MRRHLPPSALLVSIAVAACHEATAPKPGPPASIEAVSTTTISAAAGTAVAAPIVVHVVDAKGLSVPNAAVTFSAPGAPIGTVYSRSATTDTNGQAQTTLTASTFAGAYELSATVTGVVTAAVFTVTVTPGPAARLLLGAHAARVPTALDTLRLSATAQDQYGNIVAAPTVTWTSRDAGTLTVDNQGLVRVVKRGGPVWIVGSASSTALDSAAVSAPPSPCGSNGVTSLNVAQVITDAPSTICIRGNTTGGDYALIPFFGSPTASAQVGLEVTAKGIAPQYSASIVAGRRPGPLSSVASSGLRVPGGRVSLLNAPRVDWSFDARLRERERTVLRPRVMLARQRFGTRRPARDVVVAASSLPLQVGDTMILNSNGARDCDGPTPTKARVAAISDRAVVLSDTASPAGGFSDTELQAFASQFDTLVYSLDVAAFGTPADIDGNGRVLIFFTPAVNALTPHGSGGFVAGFFDGRDLFPLSSCAGSNQAEMFYVLVPDISGTVNGNVRSKSLVSSLVVPILGHEFQHLINASRRMYVNNAPEPFEEAWLNEGLSHVAEELLFYHAASSTPRQDLGIQPIHTQAFADAFNTYQSQNLLRYYSYLNDPAQSSPYGANDGSLEMRGAIWSFLRYAADRSRSTDGDFWYQLVNSQSTGRANLAGVLGLTDDQLSAYFRDWAVSVYADDIAPAVDARFSQASWDWRGMFATWFRQPLPFALAMVSLADGAPSSFSLDGGGSQPVAISVPAYQDVLVTVTSGGAALPSGVMLSLVRAR